ncbi:MAG: DnaD domain protein [Clostridia bacterium]|nr:DnaD domain protein [Clostridia bacterium]
MKISFKYGDSVLNLPKKAISEHLSDASRDELCVLLALAADPDAGMDEICSSLDIDTDEFMKAISFWRGSGAISVSLKDGEKLPSNRKKSDKVKKDTEESDKTDSKKADANKKDAKPHPIQPTSIPSYTTAQITDFLEGDTSLRTYIENCQQIMGKIFSSGEASSLIGIVQYLGISTDYVALLCAFCVSHGKRSVRYVEKLAVGLYDDGITKYSELEAHLKKLNRAEELQPEIQKMFGMGERALTSKEKKFIESWCGEMNLDISLIQKAYEITVTNTGKAAMPYCNSILESWHAAGYRTTDEVDAAMADYKKTKEAATKVGSFDTDEFFEAALRRSYGSEDD